jgi:hypothetical protein
MESRRVSRYLPPILAAAGTCILALLALSAPSTSPGWKLVSPATGEIARPNTGGQQTSATIFDIDKDWVNDFVITERTAAPAVVWYRHKKAGGWDRYVLEAGRLKPEAGATCGDVDGDGDMDFIAGSDGSGNQVWWWENPYPKFDPEAPWTRHAVKNSGPNKHHDLAFADVDGDGKSELIFWNQGGNQLVVARVPANPRTAGEWPWRTIFSYTTDSEMQQRATSPAFKGVNEHEGLWLEDIDGDGQKDIVGGGYWFRHKGGLEFSAHTIDAGYHFSRSAAGQLIEGGRPEVVLVVGDGVGPLLLYEWMKGTWRARTLIEKVDNGHSLATLDVDQDGHLDIFCAEMRLNGGNPESKIYLLYGDGKGNFQRTVVAEGYDNHESKIADLDGDGRSDILGKPYNHGAPGLNVWLRTGHNR